MVGCAGNNGVAKFAMQLIDCDFNSGCHVIILLYAEIGRLSRENRVDTAGAPGFRGGFMFYKG
jgi:hypothetical protein